MRTNVFSAFSSAYVSVLGLRYWHQELTAASDTRATANCEAVSWDEVFGSLNQGSPEHRVRSEDVAIQETKNVDEGN